jgi:hypothetical protein
LEPCHQFIIVILRMQMTVDRSWQRGCNHNTIG